MKASTARLLVAALSLLAALLELGAGLVQLVTAGVLRTAAAVRPRSGVVQTPPRGRPRLRVVRGADHDERARLTAALAGMGFRAPAVHRFVDGLGDRAGREPIETLLKEGLAHLAA
jgi:hypothetical protein